MSMYENFFRMIDQAELYKPAMEAPLDVTEETAAEADNLEAEAEAEANPDDDKLEVPTLDDEEEPTSEDTEEPVDDEAVDEEGIPDEVSEETATEFEKAKKVHANMIKFLDIVKISKLSFEKRFTNITDPAESADYRIIVKTFSDLIETTTNLLKTKFSSSPYHVLVKYYVSVSRVFDLIIRMTDNFIKSYHDKK